MHEVSPNVFNACMFHKLNDFLKRLRELLDWNRLSKCFYITSEHIEYLSIAL